MKEKVGIQRIDVQHDKYGWWYGIIYYCLIAKIGENRQGVIKAGKPKLSINLICQITFSFWNLKNIC